jgi:glyoxylase-like metal-dependent hydrolase (beta-lactamase superfamily II)
MYSVYALKFAEQDVPACEFFYREPSHEPVTLNFFVWLITGGPRPILVDTGFSDVDAHQRELRNFVPPDEMVRRAGVDPGDIELTVMTHLHWDHWAGHRQFPNSRFVVQSREIGFWTGPYGSNPVFGRGINVEELSHLVPLTYGGKVEIIDGDREIEPGVRLHLIGGHTEGTQVVSVDTETGPVVLAADASHFFRNIETGHPVQIASNMNDMLAGFDRINRLAGSDGTVVAGHDPQILERFKVHEPGIVQLG